MFSRNVNDTSRVVKMTIVSDATAWRSTFDCHSDNSRGVIYDRNILVIAQRSGKTPMILRSRVRIAPLAPLEKKIYEKNIIYPENSVIKTLRKNGDRKTVTNTLAYRKAFYSRCSMKRLKSGNTY